jgi:hypothetical protein
MLTSRPLRNMVHVHPEGLRAARLLMVLSSISPLFVLWAIRGSEAVPDIYFIPFCAFLVILPNAMLLARIRTAQNLQEKREIVIGTAEDHRGHLLVYLFAMLLPLYASDLGNWRHMAAALAAVVFITLLFYRLNLHYMNVVFAVLSYHVFTVRPPENVPLTGKSNWVLITKRPTVDRGERLVAYRLSDTVYLEAA